MNFTLKYTTLNLKKNNFINHNNNNNHNNPNNHKKPQKHTTPQNILKHHKVQVLQQS
jgi:hypothetical protein